MIVSFGTKSYSEIAKSIAPCPSRNSVSKSCKFTFDSPGSRLDQNWLALMFKPFTSNLQSEANVNLREVMLHLPCSSWNCKNAIIVNLVLCHSTLEKLELRFSH